jgi:5-methylcytosine-specific restriction endonuclease McrA
MDVLVLSNTYQPLSRVPWQEGISLLFSGRCEVVEEYADRFVHSACETFNVPCIIRFLRKVSSKIWKRRVKFSRKNVWLRDKGRCQYCSTKVPMTDFTYDHVVPQCRGGKTKWDNIVVACIPCNQRKGSKTLIQARMRLKTLPIRPKTLPGGLMVVPNWSDQMPESWKDYLGTMSYWCDTLT